MVGLVLRKIGTIVHFIKSKKANGRVFELVLLEVFEQAGQLRQFLLGLGGHKGTEQEQCE